MVVLFELPKFMPASFMLLAGRIAIKIAGILLLGIKIQKLTPSHILLVWFNFETRSLSLYPWLS